MFGEDTSEDLNNFGFLLKLKYALKTLYLVLIMLSISFFIGMAWHKFVDTQIELLAIYYKDDPETFAELKSDSFYRFFDKGDLEEFTTSITFMYFSFTTLTTVGFGDLSPQTEYERLFGAFLLLFGVAIFSYCMGIFIEILDSFINFNSSIEDNEADDLSQFFSCLKNMNGDLPINHELKSRIERFFAFSWNYDKNMAVKTPEDIAIF